MKITVLKYGESTFEEAYIFKGGDLSIKLPISFVFYLIETEDKKILVDVGCNDGAGFVMKRFKKPVDVLAEYGLTPEDITDVILTHSHHDHVEAIGDYPHAQIYIQQEEYPYAKPYIPSDSSVHTFDETFTLCNNVTVQKIGGHSLGSSIILCHTAGKDYVLCGDECYVKACLEKQIPTGASCRPEASLQFIKKYSGTDYVPLLFHDPSILDGCIGYEVITETA